MQSPLKLLLLVSIILFQQQTSPAQTIWSGAPIIFQKADSTDWLLPENQDRITDSVWITRQFRQGIFNIKQENEFDRFTRKSPLGTEWANGKISDGIENLSFTTWDGTKSGQSAMEVGVDKVLHLIAEDIYIDIKFLSWTAGGGGSGTGFGGGFRYQRSTPLVSNSVTPTPRPRPNVSYRGSHVEISCGEPIISIKAISLTGNTVLELHPDQPVFTQSILLDKLSPGIYVVVVNETFPFKVINSW